MSDLVVDTNVVSYGIRRDTRFEGYRSVLEGHRLVISFMTLAELRLWTVSHQWGQSRRDQLEELLHREYALFSADEKLCDLWVAVSWEAQRKGRPIHCADAWIAATALRLGVPLVTHNAKDFECLESLELISSE